MMLPLYWAGALPISQSPITAYSDGDGANLAQYTSTRLVNIDHYGKFRSARTAPVREDTEAIYVGCLGQEGDPCRVKAPNQHLFRRVIRF